MSICVRDEEDQLGAGTASLLHCSCHHGARISATLMLFGRRHVLDLGDGAVLIEVGVAHDLAVDQHGEAAHRHPLRDSVLGVDHLLPRLDLAPRRHVRLARGSEGLEVDLDGQRRVDLLLGRSADGHHDTAVDLPPARDECRREALGRLLVAEEDAHVLEAGGRLRALDVGLELVRAHLLR